MDARPDDHCRNLRPNKNITRTTSAAHRGSSRSAGDGGGDEARHCAFIAAGQWEAGAPPYCGRPALSGSAYCREHASLCGVDPASRRGVAIVDEQERAAQEIAIDVCAVPEPSEEEPLEAWELPNCTHNAAEEA